MDFYGGSRKRWQWQMGVPLYYQLLGKRLFGKGIKYPLGRFARMSEKVLRRKLYLDLTGYKRSSSLMPRYEREIVPGFETVKGLNMVDAAA